MLGGSDQATARCARRPWVGATFGASASAARGPPHAQQGAHRGRFNRLACGLRSCLGRLGIATQGHIDDAFWHIENQLLAPLALEQASCSAEDALKNSHLCDHMNPDQIAGFSAHWNTTVLPAGQALFSEGTEPCGLYVLLEGQLSAWHHTGHSNERLMRFCPGSMLGEMALIDGKPRSATVRADTPCTVLFLPLNQFEALSRQETDLGQILQNNLARELALRIRLANQSLALTQ